MDHLNIVEFAIAVFVVLAVFEIFADRRNKQLLRALQSIGDRLEGIESNTDTRIDQKRIAMKMMLQEQFPEIADEIGDDFVNRAFVDARILGRSRSNFIRDRYDPSSSKRQKKRVERERDELLDIFSESLTSYDTQKIASNIRALPKDKQRMLLNRLSMTAMSTPPP